jgi:hypothetical protein
MKDDAIKINPMKTPNMIPIKKDNIIFLTLRVVYKCKSQELKQKWSR